MVKSLQIVCGVAAMALFGAVQAAEVRLQGAGATFPNPLYQRWVGEYQKTHGDVKIDYQSIGSGGGIKGITDQTVDFAGSDAPMNAKELEAAGGKANIVEVPSCAGGVVPAYNLPGVKELNFTGELLADIYIGKVSKWNDPKIAAVNPGVKLPDLAITPVSRTDGSGTTFVWTNYLATQSEEFKGNIGAGKQVKWPVGQGGKGNEGVTQVVQQTAGAIGYIELAYANQNHIAFGAVRNKSGKFIKASPESISAAGAGAVEHMSGTILAADIWNQPGDAAYPIASFTYLIIYKDLKNVKSPTQAQALVDFLWWASHDGQKFAAELDYAPLAGPVLKKIESALGGVTFQGKAIKPSR
jgi:phosphate transport system substrate-binding protein